MAGSNIEDIERPASLSQSTPGILSSATFITLAVSNDCVAVSANNSDVISLPCNSAAIETAKRSCATCGRAFNSVSNSIV